MAALSASPMYRERPDTAFDGAKLLDAEMLAEFVQATQPKEWAKLAKQFPGSESATLAAQVSALIAKPGTLEVLRNGVSFNGINLQLAFFKPSADGNPEHQARYEGNRFSIMRQVHFSTRTPDQSVDMVIFLNGIPIISIELKNHFTGQNVQRAIAQYRRRDPREPFFPRCLVHFALDDDAAYMATRLEGKETMLLPFNRDVQNPITYDRFASSYLWADFSDTDGRTETGVLKADSLLELIQNYLHFERDEKTGKEKFVFPRFHQLLVVRKLLAHAKASGSGHNYLIQHSAGSGKSNSIAWLAHQLANLCGGDGQPVFDIIIIITDRRVLDRQLQDTIKQFEKIKGIVTKIDRNTKQLVKALERGDKIIITTLQKFGFVGELAKMPGRKFAVIVDEAHSSQTGENLKDLKIVLANEEQLKAALDKDDEREEEDQIEAELEKIQKARRLLLEYVDRHEFAIRRKAHIIVDHFTRKTVQKIEAQAKAMVVTHSRAHAVLYKQAIDEGAAPLRDRRPPSARSGPR